MSRVEFKVVLLGQKYGGKTCLIERYLNDRFHDVPYQTTIGASFGAKQFSVNGRNVTMGIWDTAGGERYETMCRIYYRGARAAVVCYDVTDNTSFEKAQFWVTELKKHEEHCKIYMCGTKTDLIDEEPTLRKVNLTQIHRYARDINAEVLETSSKTGHNVKELFNKIAEDYQAQSSDGSACKLNGTLRLQSPGKKSACCS